MNINWEKWVTDLLPLSLRKQRIKTICLIMIGPAISLWSDFQTWKKQIQIKLSVTPQAIMLQKICKDLLGITASIIESDGRPTDFIVRASVYNRNKEGQLLALIDRYKQAGKSYRFENTEISFEHVWTKYICEKREETEPEPDKYQYQHQWTNYVCEVITVYPLPANYVYVKCQGPYIYVRTEYPPTSNLSVGYDLTYSWTLNGEKGESRSRGSVAYSAGETGETQQVSTPREFVKILTADITLNITRDNTYSYVIIKTIL